MEKAISMVRYFLILALMLMPVSLVQFDERARGCSAAHAAERHEWLAGPDAGKFQYSGMVMPVDGLIYQAAPGTPKGANYTIETVWCGSYYYFPLNYTIRNEKEREQFSTRSTGSGSHPGVDIQVFPGTPVRSVARGVIVIAEWREGWGNLIVIEHHIPREGIVYSCYGHLAGYKRTGGIVQKGEYIGYTGQTGTTYPHLHFQMDRNPFPFYPTGSGAYPYTSPLHPVNRITCMDQVKKNTFDPLLFVKKHQKP